MSQEAEAPELSITPAELPTAPTTATATADRASTRIAEEQLAYARLLDQGMKLGMLGLVVTFGIYLTGLLPPFLKVADLPQYWTLPVKQYLAVTGIHPGWSWVGMVHHGDFANFLAIAFLAGVTIVCYLSIIPVFIRKRETTFAWLAILEVLVLGLAASGVLGGGAH